MTIFDLDVAAARAAFSREGWVHVPGGLRPAFTASALAQASAMRTKDPLAGRGIAGEKEQFVFDFAGDEDYEELFDLVSAVCGLDRTRITLSERHVKAYDLDAEARPSAHKDRFSSQVSMGLSLVVPPGSHLVLFPATDTWDNPFLDTSLKDSLEPEQHPDVVLQGAPEVIIEDAPGDVIIFRGSAFWHLRRQSAGTMNVYLKFNDFGSDPLGEDPATARLRKRSIELAEAADSEVDGAVAVLARRFDSVVHEYRREGWPERRLVRVWGANPFAVSEGEEQILRSLEGGRRVTDLLDGEPETRRAAVRRLVRRGAIDLLT